MLIETVSVVDVRPYSNNPRKNTRAVDAVSESIRQCGYCSPIVVDENMLILAGHTRLMAIKKLGWTEVEVCIKEGLTDEQKRKYRLLDNKTNELAAWDDNALARELEGLDFGEFDFGFDIEEYKEIIEDEPPEPPEEPASRIGDIYQCGRHRVMCGDSTSQDDVKALVAGRSMDILLTDPPYNVNYHGAAGNIKNDNMGDSAFRQFLHDAFAAAVTVMKPGAAYYIWHSDSEGYNFRGACVDAGLKIRQCLIWVKNSLILGRQDYQWRHEPCLYGELPINGTAYEQWDDETEPCLYGWVDGGSHYFFRNRKQTTVLEFDKPQKSKEHPTMKPVKLFDYQIKGNTRIGESVLDLFGGSGTTIAACEQNGRDAYIMELDPKYCDVIIKRWENLTGEKVVKI